MRKGNILIGDKNLLNEFFREKRFSNYLLGEIHIIDKRLIPNSRRDDFEDNELRDELYDCFLKKIGLPFSKKIRKLSLKRSNLNKITKDNNLLEKAKIIAERGYCSIRQKERLIEYLLQMKNNNGDNDQYIDTLIKNIQNSKHFLDLHKKRYSESTIEFLKLTFDIIYNECQNKHEAEKIIEKIIAE